MSGENNRTDRSDESLPDGSVSLHAIDLPPKTPFGLLMQACGVRAADFAAMTQTSLSIVLGWQAGRADAPVWAFEYLQSVHREMVSAVEAQIRIIRDKLAGEAPMFPSLDRFAEFGWKTRLSAEIGYGRILAGISLPEKALIDRRALPRPVIPEIEMPREEPAANGRTAAMDG
ncbi:MAG: hypothetical protein PHZ23_15080 [Acidiphilium sp.]|nr:hypothetical protein [Acidiphilium sp.]